LTGISVEQPLDPTGFHAQSRREIRRAPAMVVLRMVKRHSPVSDRFAEPFLSAASAHHGGFDIRESWIDRIVVLSVCGEVDVLSAPQLTEAIHHALAQAPVGLIVDLTDVNFLAAIGMSVLVETQEQADAISARFGVVAQRATSRPIKLLGIDANLALYSTLDDALRNFR
jgi:anti-sigma B factor antagonist